MSDRIILGPDGRKYITNEPLLHEDKQAAELRRLHAENEALKAELHEQARVNGMGGEREARLMALNAELVDALKLALSSYGVMMMGNPPQEAWDVWKVEEKARAALAKAQGENK